MLQLPEGRRCIKVLGIDPGTDTMGYAPLVLDTDTMQITGIGVHTYKAARDYKYKRSSVEYYGDKYTRFFLHADHLVELLETFEPDYVIGEAIFHRRGRTQAFRGLAECWMMIRSVCQRYRLTLPIEQIEPVPVKQNLGVGVGVGKRAELKDKLLVERAVLARKDMTFDADSHPDEHSYDATAIGLYFIDNLLGLK